MVSAERSWGQKWKALHLLSGSRQGVCRHWVRLESQVPFCYQRFLFPFPWAAVFAGRCWNTVLASPGCCSVKKKGERAVVAQSEPSQAVWSRNPPLPPPAPLSAPVLLLQSQAHEKVPLTCFRALSDPIWFYLVLIFPLVLDWGGKLSCEPPWHIPPFFSHIPRGQCRASSHFAFVWETTLGAVFRKHFCLFSGEHPFVGKTLLLLYTLFKILLCFLGFFSKLWFHFTISP